MWDIIGWIIWGIALIIALSFVYSIRIYVKNGRAFQTGSAVIALFLFLVPITFLLFDWSKIHIIWVVPIVYMTAFFLFNGTIRIPILTPVVMYITNIFILIITVGIKSKK